MLPATAGASGTALDGDAMLPLRRRGGQICRESLGLESHVLAAGSHTILVFICFNDVSFSLPGPLFVMGISIIMFLNNF